MVNSFLAISYEGRWAGELDCRYLGDTAEGGRVAFEGPSAFFCKATHGKRVSAFECLRDGQIADLFEPRQMTREIALRKCALALEVDEVGLFHGVKDGHDHQTGRLMDHLVERGKVLAAAAAHDCVCFGSGLRWRYLIRVKTPSRKKSDPAVARR